MAFSVGNKEAARPMAEINVTPLVDVMLVLLIIFMITAPLMYAQGQGASCRRRTLEQEGREDAADAAGHHHGDRGRRALYWNDEPVTRQAIESRLSVEAQKTPQPPVNIRGDKTTKYRLDQRSGEDRAGAGHAQGRLRRHPPKKGQ